MATSALFSIAHDSPGRLRLRLAAEQPLDPHALDAVAKQLANHESVHEVRVSLRTRSVLALYDGEPASLLAVVRASGAELAPDPARTPMLRLQRALEETEARLAQRTRGRLTLSTLAFYGTAAAGLWQTGRGRLLPAGLTLLEYALEAMRREAAREAAELQGRS